MRRISIFLYGLVSYTVFVATFLYVIGFVGNLWVPKSPSIHRRPCQVRRHC